LPANLETTVLPIMYIYLQQSFFWIASKLRNLSSVSHKGQTLVHLRAVYAKWKQLSFNL